MMTVCCVLAMMVTPQVGSDPPIDFDTDVMPILTKAGCNVGACHGAAAGRGEFYLSLYGSRPAADHMQMTQAFGGRRVNPADPEASLLLKKATEEVSHEGGARIEFGSPDHDAIIRWIAAGASRDHVRSLNRFELQTARHILNVGESTPLTATAFFDDGLRKNVRQWTVVKADDPSAVHIADDGRVTVNRPGRHILTGRYLDQVVTVEVIAPYADITSSDNPSPENPSPVDDFIDQRLRALGLTAMSPGRDEVLLRRLYLDTTGRLPTDKQRSAFLSSSSSDRVDRLIDALTATGDSGPSAFDQYWTYVLSQQMQVADVKRGQDSRRAYYDWLQDSLRKNRGYDEIVTSLVTASGDPEQRPYAQFYRTVQGPNATAELISRAFMGVRLQCANCHDHPLDHWTQEDYHGLSAIFAGLRSQGEIRIGKGTVINPATGDTAASLLPGGGDPGDEIDKRPALAAWLADQQNPMFARAFVNRVWARLMGRGLVEPVDDLRDTNPATHPELLDWLAQDFANNGFQLRRLVRTICRSRAYQRTAFDPSVPMSQQAYYGGAISRRMSPEVYRDAIMSVLESSGTRQVSYDGLAGRVAGDAETAGCQAAECETLVVATTDLAVQLDLLNGKLINDQLNAGSPFLSRLENASWDRAVVVVYGRALGREATETELAFWKSQLSNSRDGAVDEGVLQDFLWSVLTSREFLTSH